MPLNGTSQGTILVADDNDGIREPLVELLRVHGYRVIAVADGEHALMEICSQPVDLALLDVMMPGRTGFSVCRAVKARPLARSIEAKDPYTEGHCDRLSRYTVSLGEKIGLAEEQRVALRRGGIVHDIGKVAVPEFVLLKPGPLDAAERKIMEEHTIVGERICAPLKSFRNVLPIIRSHHEKQDGTGYPDHLKRGEIPLEARILQTVDIYDSLTTDRPYRKALSQEKALQIMWEETRRGWWDAELLAALQGLLQESPKAFCAPVA